MAVEGPSLARPLSRRAKEELGAGVGGGEGSGGDGEGKRRGTCGVGYEHTLCFVGPRIQATDILGGLAWLTDFGGDAKMSRDVKQLSLLFVVGLLLNVPATCQCISGTDLLRQVYVQPR